MIRKKRKEILKKRRKDKQKNQIRVLLSIFASVSLLAFLLILPNLLPVTDIIVPPPRDYSQADGNTLGDPNAPVELIVYSDFQCTYCETFYSQTLGRIIDDFVLTGKLHLVFKPFGDWGGPESVAASQAVYCAAEENKFWEYHDILFSNFSTGNSNGYSTRRLIAFADTIGFNESAFRTCLEENRYYPQIQENQEEGIALGITGTPSLLLNEKLILGFVTYEEFLLEYGAVSTEIEE